MSLEALLKQAPLQKHRPSAEEIADALAKGHEVQSEAQLTRILLEAVLRHYHE